MSMLLLYTRSGIVYVEASPQAVKAIAQAGEPAAIELKAIIEAREHADTSLKSLKALIGGDLTQSIKLVGSIATGMATGEVVALSAMGIAAGFVAAPWVLLIGAIAGAAAGFLASETYDYSFDNALKFGQQLSDLSARGGQANSSRAPIDLVVQHPGYKVEIQTYDDGSNHIFLRKADGSTSTLTYDYDGIRTSRDDVRANGDRSRTDYHTNGQISKFAEIDGAGNDSYATVITTYDSVGRIDSRGVTNDDGSLEWTDYDQANELSRSIWSNRIDAQGREDWRRITDDSGGVEWIDYDQGNQYAFKVWSNRVNAQGHEDWRRVVDDSGGVEWTDFDPSNEYSYRVWSNRVNAQGHEDWRRVTDDFGAVEWTDFDPGNEYAYRTWNNRVDAQGREDWRRVTDDFGGVE